MKWAVPNRGPVWVHLTKLADKQALADLLAKNPITEELRHFGDLLRSHCELQRDLIQAAKDRQHEPEAEADAA